MIRMEASNSPQDGISKYSRDLSYSDNKNKVQLQLLFLQNEYNVKLDFLKLYIGKVFYLEIAYSSKFYIGSTLHKCC